MNVIHFEYIEVKKYDMEKKKKCYMVMEEEDVEELLDFLNDPTHHDFYFKDKYRVKEENYNNKIYKPQLIIYDHTTNQKLSYNQVILLIENIKKT